MLMEAGSKCKALIVHFKPDTQSSQSAMPTHIQLFYANTVITHQSNLSVTSIRVLRGLTWSGLIKVIDLLDNCQLVWIQSYWLCLIEPVSFPDRGISPVKRYCRDIQHAFDINTVIPKRCKCIWSWFNFCCILQQKMTEVTPWEAFKNGRRTRGVCKSGAEERSRGCKLTKAAAEQRAAGDNNHYNETVVSLLKYLCIKNSPSIDVHRRQSSLSAPALISESFHCLLWNASFPQSKTRLSDNWAEKATIWYWEERKDLALGGPTSSLAWHKQPNYLLCGPFRKPASDIREVEPWHACIENVMLHALFRGISRTGGEQRLCLCRIEKI